MIMSVICFFFFFSSRRRHTRFDCDWSSDVCSSDLACPERVRKDAEVGPEKGGTAMSWLHKPVSTTSRERVPPGQALTTKFPILHVSDPPVFHPHSWMLKLVGEVEHPLTLTWEQVLALPS